MKMNVLIDFLRLHPVFTQRGIRAAWYLYLLGATAELVTYLGFSLFATPAGFGLRHYFLVGEQLVRIVANVILVRIFLEIALRYLFPRSSS
jgi:hypothetical protein